MFWGSIRRLGKLVSALLPCFFNVMTDCIDRHGQTHGDIETLTEPSVTILPFNDKWT